MKRTGFSILLLATLLLTGGCNTFYHNWEQAGRQPTPPGIEGRWEGTWQSDASGHHDRLRCIISTKDDHTYLAQFQANYRKILNFGYTIPLQANTSNGETRFTGDADIGWLAGGLYHYEGHANATNFFSTYSCKYDHGTFTMSRPEAGAAAAATASFAPVAASTQMLVVTTPDWSTVPGTLRRFERADTSSNWRQAGAAIPIVVGRNGLGWGRGLAASPDLPGPVKHEGDGKSPAGIFRLSSAFGLEKASGVKLPYRQLTSAIECVDDVKSVHYNSIVDRDRAGKLDWDSSEKMQSIGEPYRLGIVVDHNFDPRVPAGGSCIFMHIWKDARTGTSGCTAMAPNQMESLLPWLNPAAHPVLVQLPDSEYKQLQKDWKLPPL